MRISDWSSDVCSSDLRPPDHSQITADEHAFLEQLHPMIEASLRRVRAMEGERSRRASYEHLLRQVPLTLMFVNAAGESLFANNEAEKQCGRWNRSLRSAVSSDAGFRLTLAVADRKSPRLNSRK